MNEDTPSKNSNANSVVDRAVELVYRLSYAPVDVTDMLSSAENRSRIRKLTPAQLFFGLTRLDDQQMQLLLPHVTEEQWTAVLDLSLWARDTARTERLLVWQRHLIDAPDAVARKIWRSTPVELWELAFSRDLTIARRLGEDEYDRELDADADILMSADGAYAIQLPEDRLRAALWSALLPRLFALEPEQIALLLEESLFRTESELEEEAYRERCRRLGELGFQDYFEAISVYSPLAPNASLPLKADAAAVEVATLPQSQSTSSSGSLLFRALSHIEESAVLQQLMEEIFYLCNKILSADKVSPDDPGGLRETIHRGLASLNLGLSVRVGDEIAAAEVALRRYYLVSLFQIAYGQLLELQSRARKQAAQGLREDLFEQATLEALCEPFPRFAELVDGRVLPRYFWSREDLEEAHRQLDRMQAG